MKDIMKIVRTLDVRNLLGTILAWKGVIRAGGTTVRAAERPLETSQGHRTIRTGQDF